MSNGEKLDIISSDLVSPEVRIGVLANRVVRETLLYDSARGEESMRVINDKKQQWLNEAQKIYAAHPELEAQFHAYVGL